MSTPRALLIVALLFFLGACQQQEGEAGSAMQDPAAATEAQNKAAMDRIYEVFTTGNLALADDLIAVNAIEHQVMPGVTETGLAGFKQTVTMVRQAFSDFHVSADHMIAEGDYVAVRFTMRGTNDGPMMDMPATGKRFEISGIEIVRFENGKAAEHWGYQDDMSMMQQLGMMPAEEPPMDEPPMDE